MLSNILELGQAIPEKSRTSMSSSANNQSISKALTLWSMLERKDHDIPDSFKPDLALLQRTATSHHTFRKSNLNPTEALASIPLCLLEDLGVEGWKS
jgi:hypothetical protein